MGASREPGGPAAPGTGRRSAAAWSRRSDHERAPRSTAAGSRGLRAGGPTPRDAAEGTDRSRTTRRSPARRTARRTTARLRCARTSELRRRRSGSAARGPARRRPRQTTAAQRRASEAPAERRAGGRRAPARCTAAARSRAGGTGTATHHRPAEIRSGPQVRSARPGGRTADDRPPTAGRPTRRRPGRHDRRPARDRRAAARTRAGGRRGSGRRPAPSRPEASDRHRR